MHALGPPEVITKEPDIIHHYLSPPKPSLAGFLKEFQLCFSGFLDTPTKR